MISLPFPVSVPHLWLNRFLFGLYLLHFHQTMTPTLQTNLVPLLNKSVNIFIAVVIFYVLKYLLELDFHCNCSGEIKWYDIVYLIGPPCAVFPLLYIVCKPYQKLFWGYFTRTYTYIFWEHLQFLVLLHSFWIAAVLLDGDWFACMLANHDNKEQADIPCKAKNSLTLNEMNILTHHKNISMVSKSPNLLALHSLKVIYFIVFWSFK